MLRRMRVAVISDVHGNAFALEAVLRDIRAAAPDLTVNLPVAAGIGLTFKMDQSDNVVLAYFGEGAGIAVRKGDSELLGKLNGAIQAIRANGQYQQIQGKYFDFDIYGE